MKGPLTSAVSSLLERLQTERVRGPNLPSTFRVGGLSKLGSQLERTLRLAVSEAAEETGSSAEALLAEVGARMPPARAAAGQLAMALRRVPRAKVRDAGLRLVLDDLKDARSAIQRVIDLRNRVTHDGEIPPDADEALDALRGLFERSLSAGAPAR